MPKRRLVIVPELQSILDSGIDLDQLSLLPEMFEDEGVEFVTDTSLELLNPFAPTEALVSGAEVGVGAAAASVAVAGGIVWAMDKYWMNQLKDPQGKFDERKAQQKWMNQVEKMVAWYNDNDYKGDLNKNPYYAGVKGLMSYAKNAGWIYSNYTDDDIRSLANQGVNVSKILDKKDEDLKKEIKIQWGDGEPSDFSKLDEQWFSVNREDKKTIDSYFNYGLLSKKEYDYLNNKMSELEGKEKIRDDKLEAVREREAGEVERQKEIERRAEEERGHKADYEESERKRLAAIERQHKEDERQNKIMTGRFTDLDDPDLPDLPPGWTKEIRGGSVWYNYELSDGQRSILPLSDPITMGLNRIQKDEKRQSRQERIQDRKDSKEDRKDSKEDRKDSKEDKTLPDLPEGWTKIVNDDGSILYQYPYGDGGSGTVDPTRKGIKLGLKTSADEKERLRIEEENLPEGWKKIYKDDGSAYYEYPLKDGGTGGVGATAGGIKLGLKAIEDEANRQREIQQQLEEDEEDKQERISSGHFTNINDPDLPNLPEGWKKVLSGSNEVLYQYPLADGKKGNIYPNQSGIDHAYRDIEQTKQEVEQKRIDDEAEAKRVKDEADQKRIDNEAEAKRVKDEEIAEQRRIKEEDDAEQRRIKEEDDARRASEINESLLNRGVMVKGIGGHNTMGKVTKVDMENQMLTVKEDNNGAVSEISFDKAYDGGIYDPNQAWHKPEGFVAIDRTPTPQTGGAKPKDDMTETSDPAPVGRVGQHFWYVDDQGETVQGQITDDFGDGFIIYDERGKKTVFSNDDQDVWFSKNRSGLASMLTGDEEIKTTPEQKAKWDRDDAYRGMSGDIPDFLLDNYNTIGQTGYWNGKTISLNNMDREDLKNLMYQYNHYMKTEYNENIPDEIKSMLEEVQDDVEDRFDQLDAWEAARIEDEGYFNITGSGETGGQTQGETQGETQDQNKGYTQTQSTGLAEKEGDNEGGIIITGPENNPVNVSTGTVTRPDQNIHLSETDNEMNTRLNQEAGHELIHGLGIGHD